MTNIPAVVCATDDGSSAGAESMLEALVVVPDGAALGRTGPVIAALVMGTRGRGGVGEVLLGSASAGAVCAAARPVVLAGPRS